ncbi:MAG: SLC13 family permease [Pirellulaceae bacterium]
MISGYVLAIPVFFDTVFYLLVPLARSLHRRTGKEYLRYLLAIAGGGAITHTLVPPTPGPLLMASILNVDFGLMIIVGLAVSFPAAIVGLLFARAMDAWKPIEMRPIGNDVELAPPNEDKLPPLWESLLPVMLPVALIAVSTVAVTYADREDAAALQIEQVSGWENWGRQLAEQQSAEGDNPGKWLLDHSQISDATRAWWLAGRTPTEEQSLAAVQELNQVLRDKEGYRETAFLGVSLPKFAKGKVTADNTRMKPVEATRMNRELLEAAYPNFVAQHEWNTKLREFAGLTLLFGNANFALLISCGIAMWTLVRVRSLTREQLALGVEGALMSAGVIILITAAGAAFGDMLQAAQIGPAIKERFASVQGASSGIAALLLGFSIAAVLKVAQGSSTVAMIVGAGMMVAIVGNDPLGFHPVYLATAVGSGSLVGSWMNDSGFWIFAKMGGLTEAEALRSWTPLLLVLAFTGLLVTIGLALVFPMA